MVQESECYNMYINAQKSEIMVVSRQDNISVQEDNKGESLEKVHNFKFAGSYKSADGDCTKEIKRRIAMARQMAVVLASNWKDQNITRRWHVMISCQPDGRPPQPVRPWKSGRVHLADGSKLVVLELPYSTEFGRESRKLASGVRKYGKFDDGH